MPPPHRTSMPDPRAPAAGGRPAGPSAFARAWRIASAPRREIRWQIVAPFIVLSLVTTAVGTYMATQLVGGSLADRYTNQLVEASRGASDSLVRRERVHLEWLRSVAFTEGVGAAIPEGERALEPLVLPIAANAAAERVEVYDAEGRLAYGVMRSDAGSARYMAAEPGSTPDWPALRSALEGRSDARGDKFAGIVDDAGTQWLIATAPIVEGGQVLGAVLVGTRVATVLQSVRSEALADVSLYGLDGALLGSTLAARATDQDAEAPPLVLAAGATGGLTAAGRSYRLLIGDLNLRGERVGFHSVALPTEFIASAQRMTGARMALFFAGGLLLTVLVGVALASQLTGAVSRLVLTSRRVTAGDLTARSRMKRGDEIGELGRSFDRMTDVLREQMLGAVAALVSAVDARDEYTRGHSLRVGHLASLIGESLGLDGAQCHFLQVGGYLHDIGKIGVRDAILLKPGRLEPVERASIQAHPEIALEILSSVGLPPEVIAGVVGHHERLDGSGYPGGLAGDEIDIFARVVAVADVYDAMITDRPYRAGMPLEEVLAELRVEASHHRLDPRVVEAAHLVAEQWEQQWRSDPLMSGFTLSDAPLDPYVFERAGASGELADHLLPGGALRRVA